MLLINFCILHQMIWMQLCIIFKVPNSCNNITTVLKCTEYRGFARGSVGKGSACNAGGMGLFPGSGRSPGEGNGYPFQYSSPGNPTDRGAWQATVHRIAKSWTRLSD